MVAPTAGEGGLEYGAALVARRSVKECMQALKSPIVMCGFWDLFKGTGFRAGWSRPHLMVAPTAGEGGLEYGAALVAGRSVKECMQALKSPRAVGVILPLIGVAITLASTFGGESKLLDLEQLAMFNEPCWGALVEISARQMMIGAAVTDTGKLNLEPPPEPNANNEIKIESARRISGSSPPYSPLRQQACTPPRNDCAVEKSGGAGLRKIPKLPYVTELRRRRSLLKDMNDARKEKYKEERVLKTILLAMTGTLK
ncbi:hypothetical protein DFJ77DRAFT_439102 [Powellomyces hirtus]|nr:hypothetical protein DFJ77DRAFT_439102 [Powellomyces hirtus]